MGICPNCGDWVDEGDICMSCGGAGSSREDDSYEYSGSSGYYYNPSPESIMESQKRNMRWKRDEYEASINAARGENDSKSRLDHYNDALNQVEEYWKISKRSGMDPCDMPRVKRALSDADVEWLRQRHYESQQKFSLFGNDETDELEHILERSGNKRVIRENKSRYRDLLRANEERYRIESIKNLRREYFEHIKKANRAVDDGKLNKAMKEYRRADNCWGEYFTRQYRKDSQWSEMPKNKFPPDAVDHMMVLYVKTHPIVTSNKYYLKLHGEIVEMLDGKWDGHITEADMRAQEILDEKHRRKEELEDIATDVIVGARIVGDKIFQRIRK